MLPNRTFVLGIKFHFGDVPPFVVDAMGAGRDRFFGSKALDFQDISVRKKFRVTAPIGVGRLLVVGNPFGEKEIAQLITDPAFGVTKADFEGFGVFLL